MTCREFWNQMPELEFGPEQPEHARQCPACAALLESQKALAEGLQRLAADNRKIAAPAGLEARLTAAFRNHSGAAGSRAPARGWWAWIPAAAAVAALTFLILWWYPTRLPSRGTEQAVAPVVSETLAADSGFIPLPYAEEASVSDDGDLVDVELSRATLVAWGVALPDGDPREAVEAEVLLDAGGAPQAVRLVQ
ncbi:MAG: hypothetical protein C5B51_05240 [Terriglobia bacterium]|nr:MAG: hypothetical protein C5B51_05240 [Terriglobia bacterium]